MQILTQFELDMDGYKYLGDRLTVPQEDFARSLEQRILTSQPVAKALEDALLWAEVAKRFEAAKPREKLEVLKALGLTGPTHYTLKTIMAITKEHENGEEHAAQQQ